MLLKLSLRWLIPGIFILCSLPMLLLFGVEHIRQEREFLRGSIISQALLALQATQSSLLSSNAFDSREAFQQALSTLRKAHDVKRLILVDSDENVLSASQASWINRPLIKVTSLRVSGDESCHAVS